MSGINILNDILKTWRNLNKNTNKHVNMAIIQACQQTYYNTKHVNKHHTCYNTSMVIETCQFSYLVYIHPLHCYWVGVTHDMFISLFIALFSKLNFVFLYFCIKWWNVSAKLLAYIKYHCSACAGVVISIAMQQKYCIAMQYCLYWLPALQACFRVIKVGVVYVNVCISRHLNEELAWD